AFTVTNGPVGNVQFQLDVPPALRPGQQGVVTVDYVNAGQTDVPAPLLNISGDNAELRLASQTAFAGPAVQALGVNTDGPAGLLTPGAAGRVSLVVRPTVTTGTVGLSVSTVVPEAVLDWAGRRDDARPFYIPADAWNVIWRNFMASVGMTAGEYQAAVAE